MPMELAACSTAHLDAVLHFLRKGLVVHQKDNGARPHTAA